ncbi:hypothetical protein JCM10207_007934 [Rhodosporidiobolus poonsookiae]
MASPSLSSSPQEAADNSTPPPQDDHDDDAGQSEQDDEGAGEAGEPGKVKKKKKKRRTTAQKNEAKRRTQEQERAAELKGKAGDTDGYRGVWAMLARNKHLKYISLFNGPWLTLSQRDLQTYLLVNSNERSRASLRGLLDDPLTGRLHDPLTDRLTSLALRSSPSQPEDPDDSSSKSALTLRSRLSASTRSPFSQEYLDALAVDAIPPPLDPSAFLNAVEVRKLVDEATDLALRASSGLSAAELDSLNRNPFGMGDLGPDTNGGVTGGLYGSGGNGRGGGAGGAGGRNGAGMSAVRQHRFRALAVSKLAAAYRIDEVATAVLVMQAGENVEEIALKVSKQEPANQDARYVTYFSQKIPSRALSGPHDLEVLDWLIACDPAQLAYHRTKGVLLSSFRQDYTASIAALTAGIAQARATREASASRPLFSKPIRKKTGKGSKQSDSSSFPHDSRPSTPASGDETPSPMSSLPTGKTAGDDAERQLFFHRGMSYFHQARQIIEDEVLTVEGVQLAPGRRNDEGGAWTLRNLGLTLPNDQIGLYGSRPPVMQEMYRSDLGDPALVSSINASLRKAIRDLDRFLAHFPVYEAPAAAPLETLPRLTGHSGLDPPSPSSLDEPLTFLGRRLVHHRALTSRTHSRDPRHTHPSHASSSSPPSSAPRPSRALLTTFHPYLLEAHFTRLIALLLLGDFTAAAVAHARVVRLADHIEAYPVFSQPRVGSQAEYAELVERLQGCWARSKPSEPATSSEDGEDGAAGGLRPEDKAHEGASGPASAALQSLDALTGLFSAEFRDAYVRRAEDWWARTGRREEEAHAAAAAAVAARRGGGARSDAVLGGSSLQKLAERLRISADTNGATDEAETEGGSSKGGWMDERKKTEDKMRKIDPSYAPSTTAHTELVLAYLLAAVLPPLEAQAAGERAAAEAQRETERKVGKGKGRAADGDDLEDGGFGAAANGWGAGGSGASVGAGSSGGVSSFNPFGTAPRSSSTSAGASGSGSGSGGWGAGGSRPSTPSGEGGSSDSKGKGKGKGKAAW